MPTACNAETNEPIVTRANNISTCGQVCLKQGQDNPGLERNMDSGMKA